MFVTINHPDNVPQDGPIHGTCGVHELITQADFAESMSNRLMSFAPGSSTDTVDHTNDTFLYVIEGDGLVQLTTKETVWREHIEPNSAMLIRAGDTWHAETEGPLIISATTVPVPPAPYSSHIARKASNWQPTIHMNDVERGKATANREFEVLYDNQRGSTMGTLFVGHIPPLTGSEHYHLYDEICVILSGVGEFTGRGEIHDLSPGSAVAIPARMLHQIRNTSSKTELRLMGVFRPTGSPAVAFLPDGTPATVPTTDSHDRQP